METLSPFAFVTLVTLISGAGGTGLGGFIGALFKSESNAPSACFWPSPAAS